MRLLPRSRALRRRRSCSSKRGQNLAKAIRLLPSTSAARDEKLHADGALAEERAAVRIVALAKLGRQREALDENIEFTAKYPNSIHRDAIARALMGSAR